MAALGAALACSQIGTDLNAVVALEIVLPDSGFLEVGDTLMPHARLLNGAGDSVPGSVYWAALDTAVITVIDSETGATLGRAAGTGRIQARVGTLRSNPVPLTVQPALDSIRADGDIRDTVVVSGTPRDTLSDTLGVRVFAATPPVTSLRRRRITYDIVDFPGSGVSVTLLPGDTVLSDATGFAGVQVRLDGGGPPDSVVVTAQSARPDGTPVDGSPIRFVVEFRP